MKSLRHMIGLGSNDDRPVSFEDQIYDAVIEPGDVCYDVGANVGAVSLRLARLAGASGLVIAFEPVWPMYMKLCRQVQRAARDSAPIVPVPWGLSERQGDAVIRVPAGDFGQGSLADPSRWSAAHPGAELADYRVRLTTLDDIIDGAALPAPSFVKIDVEGAELLVLRGAGRMLAESHPLMLLEVFAPWEHALGYGPWDVLSLLQGQGYRFLFMCPSGLVAHEPSAAAPAPTAYEQGYNVIAYRPAQHQGRIARLAGIVPLPMQPAPMPNRLPPT